MSLAFAIFRIDRDKFRRLYKLSLKLDSDLYEKGIPEFAVLNRRRCRPYRGSSQKVLLHHFLASISEWEAVLMKRHPETLALLLVVRLIGDSMTPEQLGEKQAGPQSQP